VSEADGHIRLLLLEDHTAFRQALALALSLQPSLRVFGDAGTLTAARTMLSGVDVAVLDLDLPDGDGCGLIGELRAQSPGAHALVLTASAGRRDLARAIAAGASAVLHKSTPIAEIGDAIRRVHGGAALVPHAELVQLLREDAAQREADQAARDGLARLTARERDTLRLLGGGLSDKEIAVRLGGRGRDGQEPPGRHLRQARCRVTRAGAGHRGPARGRDAGLTSRRRVGEPATGAYSQGPRLLYHDLPRLGEDRWSGDHID